MMIFFFHLVLLPLLHAIHLMIPYLLSYFLSYLSIHLSLSLISEMCVIGSTGEEEHTYFKALFDWESGKWAMVNDGCDWRQSFCVMRSLLLF